MAMKRRRFTAVFKKRVTSETLRGKYPVQAMAAMHQVHPNQASTRAVGCLDTAARLRGGFEDDLSQLRLDEILAIQPCVSKIRIGVAMREFQARLLHGNPSCEIVPVEASDHRRLLLLPHEGQEHHPDDEDDDHGQDPEP